MKQDKIKILNFDREKPLYSEREAAARLGVSRITVLRARQRGEIAFYRISSRILFSELHLDQYLSSVERPVRVARTLAR